MFLRQFVCTRPFLPRTGCLGRRTINRCAFVERCIFEQSFDYIWSRRDLDLWPFDLEVYSVYLCSQLHLSANLVKCSRRVVRYRVHKLLVYDHSRTHGWTHRRPENSMPSGCGNRRRKHIKSGFQRGVYWWSSTGDKWASTASWLNKRSFSACTLSWLNAVKCK